MALHLLFARHPTIEMYEFTAKLENFIFTDTAEMRVITTVLN